MSSSQVIYFSDKELLNEWSYEKDLTSNCVVIPWLNLLFLAPELAQTPDQTRWVAVPLIQRQLYDILLQAAFGRTVQNLEEKLRHIYPHSFLFRLEPSQIEYRNILNGFLTIQGFVELAHQILCVDFEGQIVEGTGLAELVHKLYSQIPMQIRRSNRHQIADELEELRLSGLRLGDSLWALG